MFIFFIYKWSFSLASFQSINSSFNLISSQAFSEVHHFSSGIYSSLQPFSSHPQQVSLPGKSIHQSNSLLSQFFLPISRIFCSGLILYGWDTFRVWRFSLMKLICRDGTFLRFWCCLLWIWIRLGIWTAWITFRTFPSYFFIFPDLIIWVVRSFFWVNCFLQRVKAIVVKFKIFDVWFF